MVNLLPEIDFDQEKKEILQALNEPQKRISSKYFYNKKGSELFEQITRLPEYYPSRTEKDILRKNAPQIMVNLKGFNIIELGSGDCSKISILLDAVPEGSLTAMRYIPVDFSESAIIKSANILSCNYPDMAIKGIVADFIHHTKMLAGNENKLICFLGSFH
ncbi:MAG: L-histidine N(alpha)-methyltransferase [Prolixibacteraceae bacterium]|nr:L-histidine N(alpha)-methyltransferase [Prolixibacteraceae bacterium]